MAISTERNGSSEIVDAVAVVVIVEDVVAVVVAVASQVSDWRSHRKAAEKLGL